jgi:hypothetical protein
MLLVVAAIAAGTASSCNFSLKDVRYNVVGGTLSFVKSYTTDMWEAVLPAWEDILNPADE